MALIQNRRNSALRVCFLTDSRFDAEDRRSNGNLKKRALRCIQRNVRYPVVEYSGDHVDAVFYILKEGSNWVLRKQKRKE